MATARRADRLADLAREIVSAGGRVETVAGDIADPAVRTRVIETAKAALGGLDILVNNAGVGALGPFESADPQRLRHLMEVNFFALVEMTRLAMPLLKEGKRPMIVNVSSILGHRGVPHNTEVPARASSRSMVSASPCARAGPLSDQRPGGQPRYDPHGVLCQRNRSNGRAELAPARRGERGKGRPGSHSCDPAGRHEIVPYGWGRVLLWLNRLAPRLVDRAMERYA